MKTAIQTVSFFLLFFFWFLICPSSCAGEGAIDRLSYTKQDFDVIIEGNIDGISINGRLVSRPNAEGTDAKATFTFISPESLRGLNVTLSANGEMSARLGEIKESSQAILPLADIFMPIIETGEISSVAKCKDGSVNISVRDEDCDLEYTFLQDSALPSRIAGNNKGRSIDIKVSQADEKGA